MKFNSSYLFSCLCLQTEEFPYYDTPNNKQINNEKHMRLNAKEHDT